jgi:probable phosphoglycerate mutase
MILYLIRHGETDWNRRSKIQGQADIPLNETGRRQAKLVAARMADTPVNIAYTSPLQRAKETAEIFLEGRENCPLHTNPLLKEISYGVREGQSLRLIHHCPFLRLYNYLEHPERYIPPQGGETIPQLKARCQSFLEKEICGCEPNHSGIMVFTHGAFIKAAVSVVKQLPDGDFWAGEEAKNCSVTALKFKNGRFEVLSTE